MPGISDRQMNQIVQAFELQLDVFNRYATGEQKAKMATILKEWATSLEE